MVDRSWSVVDRSWSVVDRSWSLVDRSWSVVDRSWSGVVGVSGRSIIISSNSRHLVIAISTASKDSGDDSESGDNVDHFSSN